jgi:hypothetical protein
VYAPQRFGVATPKPAPQRGFGAATCVTRIQGEWGIPVRLEVFAACWRLCDQWTPSPCVANQSVLPRERR